MNFEAMRAAAATVATPPIAIILALLGVSQGTYSSCSDT